LGFPALSAQSALFTGANSVLPHGQRAHFALP
jgi:hypothetical protein